MMDMITEDESNALGPIIISKHAITSGECKVMGRKIWKEMLEEFVLRNVYTVQVDPAGHKTALSPHLT
ncbi:unnamed protein product, partial [Brenthis ino]